MVPSPLGSPHQPVILRLNANVLKARAVSRVIISIFRGIYAAWWLGKIIITAISNMNLLMEGLVQKHNNQYKAIACTW